MTEIVWLPNGEAAVENSRSLAAAFEKGWGRGLWTLLTEKIPENAGNSCFFYRKTARIFVVNLCCLQEKSDLSAFEAAMPPEDELVQLLYDRPPLPGGEYISLGGIKYILQQFSQYLVSLWQSSNTTPAQWIASQLPELKDVGKITFHLAENKQDNDGEHPFLFLVTFVCRLDENDQPRHLPLANAVKLYAAQREKLLSVLTVIRKAGKCCPVIGELLENEKIYQVMPFSAAEAYSLLGAHDSLTACGIVLRMVNLWKKRPPKLKLALTLDIRPGGGGELHENNLLCFKSEATLDGEVLSREELEQLLKLSGGLVRFKEKWVDVDCEKIRKLLDVWGAADRFSRNTGMSFTAGMRLLAGSKALPGTPAPDPELCEVKLSQDAEALFAGKSSRNQEMPELPGELKKILRPYQMTGVQFLWRMSALGIGVFLADDMGLGKSLQVLSFLELLRGKGILKKTPALLVVPASLLENWFAEGAKFVPQLKIKLLHPAKLGRPEMDSFSRDPDGFLAGCDAVVTTYNMLLRLPELQKLHFPLVVADEAQAVKNSSSQQSRALRALQGERRIALTGTPVENHLGDLWSVGEFLNPGLLGSPAEFAEKCRRMTEKENWAPLRRMLTPIVLRRLKTDRRIISDLPEKVEKRINCSMSKMQIAVYSAVLDSMRRELSESDEMTRKGIILKYLTALKQICDHPDLYRGGALFAVAESGKLQQLERIVSRIAMKHEKVLVFTQFREMIPPLHDMLSGIFGRPGAVIHGGTPVEERGRLVKAFQQAGGIPFFILSLRAAGTGLTLTAANHVIHFDRWWNPAVENQATDRAFRIGQHKNVLVHKLVCSGTIESRIDRMLHRKQELAEKLFEKNKDDLPFTEWSDEELFELVKLENFDE